MADKQATVYVVDLGKSMGEKRLGREETDLEFAMKWVWDRITTTVMTGRKTDTIGVVGFRTDSSDNPMVASDDAYENITVLNPICQVLMPQLRELRERLKPNRTDRGDCISAVVVAIHMIVTYCKKLKYIRNICLVTNGTGSFDPDGLEDIVAKIKAEGIHLTVLGVDFDDPEYGFKEEDKDPIKLQNEQFLNNLCLSCDGVFGTLAEAVSELGRPRIKKVRPTPSYKGKLTLGDSGKYDDAFSIDVERYPRTMVAKPPSASEFTVRIEGDGTTAENAKTEDSTTLQAVKQARTYQVENEEVVGGRVEIGAQQMEKGYNYGNTVVPISSTDEMITVMETEPCLEIIGFIPADKYKRYFSMSNTSIIVGMRSNDTAIMALSSLIHALFELESYAVARFVKRKNDAPLILVMAPSIDCNFECLIDVQVPFTEDVRQYKFAPLDKVKTITGKTLDKHRNLPTHDMEKYMSDYVDSMDLSKLGKDDEGNSTDYFTVDDSFSPLHRINQAVRWRAVNPNELPPAYDILTKYSHPPEELVEKSSESLKKLIAACDIKRVEPKVQGKGRKGDEKRPKSGLNVDELLASDGLKNYKISFENAIPDFKRILTHSKDIGKHKDAAKQMLNIIRELVKGSHANSNYGKVCEMLNVIREHLEYDEPSIYDDVIQELKADIIAGELGGDRMDLWEQIETQVLG